MHILLVDDSKLNRLVLRELVTEFQKEYQHAIVIDEAEDGIQAVELCKKHLYNLIFMDIMMPNMDGITATDIIHKAHKDSMIIAISAVSDDHLKRDILKNGAEDYIQKPINSEVFLKRIAHYVGIIESRKKLQPKHAGIEVINPFDSSIYNRRLSFLVYSQDSLSEFWDYFMQSANNEILADLIRLFYCIGIWQLKLGYKYYIFMEESKDFWYFTMTNAKLLNKEMLMRIIEKNYPNGIFDIVEDRVAFCIPKNMQTPAQKIAVTPKATQTQEPQIVVKIEAPKEIALTVFDFMDGEDLDELLEINDNLRSLMLVVGSSDLEISEINQIADSLLKFARIMNKYTELYNLAGIIRELGTIIESNTQIFKDKSHDIAQLCQAFNNDLALWLKKLFRDGAPSIDFMDQSLTSDANMLISFIKPSEQEAVDLDDIFDF